MPKSGHVTITKFENLHIHVEKFTDSKSAILFDLRRKITKLSRKNSFRTVASPGACGLILSIYKVVYISIKDLHAGYAQRLEKFAVKFAKN